MKRILISAIVSLMSLTTMAHDKMIPYAELPQRAKTLIESHFDRERVVSVTKDHDRRTEYEVRMADGTELEFDGNGEWTKLTMAQGGVPTALVPEAIANRVATEMPAATIVEIERHGRGFEIELSDRREMLFDATGNLIKIDD